MDWKVTQVETKPFRFWIKVSKKSKNHNFNFFFQNALRMFPTAPDDSKSVQKCSLGLGKSFSTPNIFRNNFWRFWNIFEKSTFEAQNQHFEGTIQKCPKKRVFQRCCTKKKVRTMPSKAKDVKFMTISEILADEFWIWGLLFANIFRNHFWAF